MLGDKRPQIPCMHEFTEAFKGLHWVSDLRVKGMMSYRKARCAT